MWDAAAAFWVDMLRVLERALYVAALPEMKARFLVAQYWGSHQRFFKQLCICFKVCPPAPTVDHPRDPAHHSQREPPLQPPAPAELLLADLDFRRWIGWSSCATTPSLPASAW